MNQTIPLIHQKIIDKVKDLSTNYFCKDIGLCIYLFEYAERTNDENIKSLAEDFIERICWNLPKEISILTLTDKQEISIAIDYMIEKKYIEGDINDILYDIDITIYKEIVSNRNILKKNQDLLLSIYYCYSRLKKQFEGTDEEFILRELTISLFNKLTHPLEDDIFEEPFFYTLHYKLPQFIFLIGKLFSLDIYNYRIKEILKERNFQILSRIPVLHSHRLYLLWSLIIAKESIETTIWDEHINLLYTNIDFEKIVQNELTNKGLYVIDGISSIFYFSSSLSEKSYKFPFSTELIHEKIKKTNLWKPSHWENESLSLKNGLSGLILTILSIENKIKTNI